MPVLVSAPARDEEYQRLAEESASLEQERNALGPRPTSDVLDAYVRRVRAHMAALSAYVGKRQSS
jgi:hypothetical protein